MDLKKTIVKWKKYGSLFCINPSIANSLNNDSTLGRIINFSSRWNYKNIYVINLFGLIAKSPSRLLKNKDPVGENNDLIILKALEFWRKILIVTCGWDGVIKDIYINVTE